MISRLLRRLPKDPGSQTAIGVGAAFALGALCWLLLACLSQPSDWTGKLTALQARAERLDRLQARAPGVDPSAKGAICAGAPSSRAPAIQSDLQKLLLSARLTPTEAAVRDPHQTQAGGLGALDVRLGANGDYPATVAALTALSSFKPHLLVDRVDLTTQSGFVHFQLIGRVYCRATAQS